MIHIKPSDYLGHSSTDKNLIDEIYEHNYFKCAYCEIKYTDKNYLSVDHLIPKSLLSSAYDTWDNLICACHSCNMSKGSRYPLSPDQEPLLLNPYLDDPEEHLHYDNNGMIFSNSDKGNVTITIFNLNRLDLINRRKKALVIFKNQWKQYANKNKLNEDLNLFLDEKSEFTGMKRYFSKKWNASFQGNLKNVKQSYRNFQNFIEEYNLNDKNEQTFNYYIKNRLIERVTISNFKGIEYLDLILPGYQEEKAPWLMLLGENSVGKSSILKAISLALMGSEKRNELGLKPSEFIRSGSTTGYISVFFSGSLKPITIRFKRDSINFYGDDIQHVKILLLAYGSTRILTPGKTDHLSDLISLKIENLFNPYAQLNNISSFLNSLNTRDFITVTDTLKELLMLSDQQQFSREDNRIILKEGPKRKVSLDDLSDGLKSMVALACDIILVMRQYWNNIKDAEGVVLIDELDLHLHPKWKLKVVDQLRSIFPRIQFICTTHDPLCLRGLLDTEINVLIKKPNGKVNLLQDLPTTEGMRIDQILMMDYFGLYSTHSDHYNSLFERYYTLINNNNRSGEEDKEMFELANIINKSMVLGNSKKEMIMHTVIDEYIAKGVQTISKSEFNATLKENLMKILDSSDGDY